MSSPGLEYRYALDWCAVMASRSGEAPTIFVSSPFYGVEFLQRFPEEKITLLTLPHTAERTPDGSMAAMQGENSFPFQNPFEINKPQGCVIWAEPEVQNGHGMAKQIYQSLTVGGSLYLIVSGWLSQYLPEWKLKGTQPADTPARIFRTLAWLRQAGFSIQAVFGIRSPLSFFLGSLARGLARIGRNDLADGCYLKIRKSLIVRRRASYLSPVIVVAATKS